MSPHAPHDVPDPGAGRVGAAMAHGAAALAALDAIDVAAALDAGAAAMLVERLRAVHLAMRADDPRALRRKAGLLGRLFGRDLALQAEADALAARLGVLLRDADRAADALAAHVDGQRACLDRLEAALDALRRAAADHRPPVDDDDAVRLARERRLQHLLDVDAAHALGARQLALLHAQGLALLARYRNIRDVLVPAWRQRALGAGTVDGVAQAAAASAIEADIAAELAGMAATLDPRRPDRSADQETAA
ncbi:hypothetical protein [Luteimonas sp. FCS-9]|uniref:hypothetical protein n=1 Tax=Luteimonas sp. FCS-9 TaxID=1547516 RepID=UPI00063E7C06|nr:hypothetical protein [Luteimonas sp. FCS-9]KLI98855.1 hypothetical protein WQ56_14025 [Luteimonas sp. FCS-9]